jgi:DNA-binding NarL/FixJ family response regulator
MAAHLATLLEGWKVEAIAQPNEVPEVAKRLSISLIVICATGPEGVVAAQDLEAMTSVCPIVVVSHTADAHEVRLAFKAGVRGYLPSSMGIAEVATAVRFVAGGGSYIPTSVLSSLTEVPSTMVDAVREGGDFSPRQREVLKLLREGKPNKVIAYELGMAEATVKVHIRVLMRRLNAQNRTQVVLKTGHKLQQNQPAAISNRAVARKQVPLTTFLSAP